MITNHSMPEKIAIIGAGITGLTTAFSFKKAGHAVTLYESSHKPGGVIQTHCEDGFLAEQGPHSLNLSEPSLIAFFDELKLTQNIISLQPGAHQNFVVHCGKLTPMPRSVLAFLRTPLFSKKAKLRLLKEPFIKRQKEDSHKEESLAAFVERRLGREFLDYAFNPFVAGIYAGDPHQLSLQHAFPKLYALEKKYGSLVLGALRSRRSKPKVKPQIISWDTGMSLLPRRLADLLQKDLKLNNSFVSIEHSHNTWKIRTQKDGHVFEDSFNKVILTSPPHTWQHLPLATSLKESLSSLAELPYAPISLITLGFKRQDVRHPLNGLGFLVPEVEKMNILGTLFNSSMFKNRAPEGCVTLATFIGGSRNPEHASLNQEAAIKLVLKDLNQLLDIQGSPVWSHCVTYAKAIPQYNLNHSFFVQKFNEVERQLPGLHFLGNFRNGISLPNCIQAGLEAPMTLFKC